MTRFVNVAAAQMGPIAKSETRPQVVTRLIALMREAKGRGAELVVFPELALTTFFPRWLIEDEAELNQYYEQAMPGPETQPLFDEARRLEIAEAVADDRGLSLGQRSDDFQQQQADRDDPQPDR